jgi:hypothetical protein
VRDGDQVIDISSATQGTSSTVYHGAKQQIFISYPGTVYRFDPLKIFHGNDTEFYVYEAEKQLLAMMKLPEAIDGCTLVIKKCKKTVTCHKCGLHSHHPPPYHPGFPMP